MKKCFILFFVTTINQLCASDLSKTQDEKSPINFLISKKPPSIKKAHKEAKRLGAQMRTILIAQEPKLNSAKKLNFENFFIPALRMPINRKLLFLR